MKAQQANDTNAIDEQITATDANDLDALLFGKGGRPLVAAEENGANLPPASDKYLS